MDITIDPKVTAPPEDFSVSCANLGLVHAFKSKSSSSMYTQESKKFMDNKLKLLNDECEKRVKMLTKHQLKKMNKKFGKLDDLQKVICGETNTTREILSSNPTFYCNFLDDPVVEEITEIYLGKQFIVEISKSNMAIVDTLIGATLMATKFVPVFILVSRQASLDHCKNASGDVYNLKVLLENYSNTTTRGSKRTGVSKRYATFGAHCNRSRPGISLKLGKRETADNINHLVSMVHQVEHLAKMFLPYGLLSSLMEIKERCNDTTTLDETKPAFKSVWASIACTSNYISPSHTDEDAFLSGLIISHVPQDKGENAYKNDIDMEVAVHFCFPEQNVAVALRPGDVLFFNPLYHHCLSQRTVKYANEEVYATSFYIKSGQISGNDNSIPMNFNELL